MDSDILKTSKKYEKISHFDLTLLSNFKKRWEISLNLLALLQYLSEL